MLTQNGPTTLSLFTNPASKELSIISEKSPLELSSECKRFRKFSDLVKLNHPNINPQHSEDIRAGIKLPIPPLTKLEDLKYLYQTAFLLRKRHIFLIFHSITSHLESRRSAEIRLKGRKNGKWSK